MKRTFLAAFLLAVICSFPALAQKTTKYTLSGYVRDASSGEDLIGATIYAKELGSGTATNVYGFYSLSVPAGTYSISVSYLGYDTRLDTVVLNADVKKNYDLTSGSIIKKEVVISAKRGDENVKSNEMSKIEINPEQLSEIPVLFGETDIIKTIQLLPGIQSTGDGNSGFYVRGGGPDQNLILLDEAVVYNASHLFGFFSVFNADAIKNVSILKGGMPANYGGRLSSVLSITLNDGNNNEYHGKGGVGIISSRLYVEGPLVKNKSSFMVAGRRTYADVLAQPFLNDQTRGNRYYFYDLNTKLNYRLSEKDRIYLSGYFGRDVFKFKDNTSNSINPPEFNSDWGNSTVTLRWNHLFSDKLFSNTSLIYNDYNFTFGGGFSNIFFKFQSSIRDYNFKSDFDYYASPKTKFKFGINAMHHTFNPGAASISFADQEVSLENPDRLAIELASYLLLDYEVSQRLSINAGIRASGFNQIGPFKEPISDEFGIPTGDTIFYDEWESIQWYDALEPRFSFRWIATPSSSIKGSFTKNVQYLHLASISGGTLPTDLWLPSSKYIKPQIAYQGALGYFKNFADNAYEASVEAFYKPMLNQIDFAPGANLFIAEEIDRAVLSGTGLAYGMEFFLKKSTGKLTGWIGYTLSRTTRSISPINGDQPYFPRYDRRHDISILATYRFNEQWKASAVWVYATGIAFTPQVGFLFGNIGLENSGPSAVQPFFDLITIYPDEFNEERLQSYHRGDISIIFTPKAKKERSWKGEWNLSLFNAYNRKNPYFLFDDQDESGLRIRKMIYFPILPSISYSFKF